MTKIKKALNESSSSYIGCFADYAANRDFSYQYLYTSLPMTIENCVSSCLDLRYQLAGLQQG